MRYDPIYEVGESSATPGRVFTASIGDEQVIPKDKYLDHIILGVKGAVATAAVAIETFAGVLSQYTFKVGAETRIQMSLRQLVAFMAFWYNKLPLIWENTDATGNDFIFGVKIPIQETVDLARPISHSATRTAQTNISVETLSLYGAYLKDNKGRKAIHAVAIPYTTAGATGLTNLGVKIPPIGKLVGLILQNASVFADGVIAESIQHVQIIEDGIVTNYLAGHASEGVGPVKTVGVLDPIDDLLKVFRAWDFRDEPIDLKGKTVEIKVDVQAVSEATFIIPIILKD